MRSISINSIKYRADRVYRGLSMGLQRRSNAPCKPLNLRLDAVMNCRKCGAVRITRRRAGVFSCARCGVQPGQAGFDRAGNAPPKQPMTHVEDAIPYLVGNLRGNLAPAKGSHSHTLMKQRRK